jgi:hypothetical protein
MLKNTSSVNPDRRENLLLKGLLLDLYRIGLGEVIVMHHTDKDVLLGHIVMEKGKILLKDLGLMKNISPTDVAVCWDIGIIGGVCRQSDVEWESLTYLGVDNCSFPVDLSSTRKNLLSAHASEFGEELFNFNGSIYRGMDLALESNLLPIVLLHPIKTYLNVPALAVADLRFSSIPIDILQELNELVRKSIEKKLTLEIVDIDIGDGEFEKLFSSYLPKPELG